ncbi:3'-5' exonuclease [Methylocystis heyeri]|uniref:DNA-directed DNA polymerase n=1 Tax=Methylocystis heyeri TaxID=391905 RepID=A0A6B8KE90_9HYPH|nr:3'-5' exonuclease [Methylocystis heyeri]QGM44878.1 3'-5' exonuclease [Methylocystis heyeri]
MTDDRSFALFLDVETTGLGGDDKIVSIGAIKLDAVKLSKGVLDFEPFHLVFDPGRKSHPKAEEVHGFDDWFLRHQDPFDDHASEIHRIANGCELFVAHNAAFDLTFLEREFEACGLAMPAAERYCTMAAYRASGQGGSASLSSVCQRLGLGRQRERHDALHDAWLAMQVYLWLHKSPLYKTSFSAVADSGFQNLREVPPRPEGPLPRRKARRREKALA